jgi:UDP-N-acetyl-D-mannosaminuronic acid dehydrogenase
VATPTQTFDDAVEQADAVVVAANHRTFRTPQALTAIVTGAGGGALIADPWDCWGAGQVFAHADEIQVLTSGSPAALTQRG